MLLQLIFTSNWIKPLLALLITAAALFGIVPLSAALDWQTSTPIFYHTTLRFQLPGFLESTIQNDIQYWKAEAEGNCYWVAVKLRRCSQGKAPLKMCDVMSLLRSIFPETARWVSHKKDSNGVFHLLFKDADFFYYASICSNDEAVIALITKTSHVESHEHQKLIESFAFLE